MESSSELRIPDSDGRARQGPARGTAPDSYRRIQIDKAQIDVIAERECVTHVMTELAAGRGGWLLTANVEHLRLMQISPEYLALIANASLTVADGMPLVWASRIHGNPLPGRVSGSNLIYSLSHAAAAAGRSIFLLGGDPGTADAAAAVLCRQDPSLRIQGTLCPTPGFDQDERQVQRVIAAVTAAAPDIVYVALGTPLQDRLCAQLLREHPATWHVGVGISFSFLSGDVRRAPRWMQDFGLEWLHRLAQEPRRLMPRYLRVLPVAVKLLANALAQRVTRR